MTLFSDLQTAYATWQEARNDYRMNSFRFIRRFAEAFGKYIGAPAHFTADDESKSQKPYVEVLAVSEDEEGNYSFNSSNSPFELLSQQPDGFWQTGIGLVVDRNASTFPKAQFTYLIQFVLRGTDCEMIFPHDRRFSFPVNNLDDQKSIFDYMLGLVEHTLGMQPWETSEKRPIGFLPVNGQ
jgi:hypothetical protein